MFEAICIRSFQHEEKTEVNCLECYTYVNGYRVYTFQVISLYTLHIINTLHKNRDLCTKIAQGQPQGDLGAGGIDAEGSIFLLDICVKRVKLNSGDLRP